MGSSWSLCLNPADRLKIPEGVIPHQALLAVSNVHGIIAFALELGLGFAKTSKALAAAQIDDSLVYSSMSLDGSPMAMTFHGNHDEYLLVGTQAFLYVIEVHTVLSEQVCPLGKSCLTID